jgi:hypothetical protein
MRTIYAFCCRRFAPLGRTDMLFDHLVGMGEQFGRNDDA